MDIVLITTFIAALFLVIGVAEPLAARLRLPYSVILAGLGILIGAGAIFFQRTELTDALNPVAEAILGIPIRSNVFLYVFLPTLLFQATLGMNLRRMLDDWVPILVLAVVAVVVATLSVGYALAWASTLPLAACLLIGAIVSTTDPSAVVSIFRSLSAPRRLARIIEGESLLNDAAAIALFGLFMGFVMLGVPDPSLGDAAARFPLLIGGGAVVGWLAARVAVWVMALFGRHELAMISISVALPYLAYIGAEQSIGASGVIAVVAAGLTLNLTGPGRLPPQSWANLREVWGLLAHWAGALIFILAALLIPRLLEQVRVEDVVLIGVVVVAAIAARVVILFALLPLMTALKLSPAIERPYRVAILWGGLRGAVTLALALAVTESFRVPEDIQRVVGILATGFTLFTLMVQGTTLRTVIGWLGLDRLSRIDQALSRQVVAVALQTVREDVARTSENYDLNRDIVRSEAKRFGDRLDLAVKQAEESADIVDRDRVTLGLIALAGHERDTILMRVRERTISARMTEQVLSDADRLIEGARIQGRSGYQGAARRSVAYGRTFQAAVVAAETAGPVGTAGADDRRPVRDPAVAAPDPARSGHVHRRAHPPHSRAAGGRAAARAADPADRDDRDGARGVAPAISRICRKVAAPLHPAHGAAAGRARIHRDARGRADRRRGLHRADAGSGRAPRRRRGAAKADMARDMALQRTELVRQFPLFTDLGEAALKRLGRALETRYVNPGDVIIRKDTQAKSVFFISSGAVEMESAGQTWRFGRGEMFGQLAILMNKTRRAEVRAIAPCTLLVLDETRFRRLLGRSTALRQAVRTSAEARGIDPQSLLPPGQDHTGPERRESA